MKYGILLMFLFMFSSLLGMLSIFLVLMDHCCCCFSGTFAPTSAICLFLIDLCEHFTYYDYNCYSVLGAANIFFWSLACILTLFMVSLIRSGLSFFFCFCFCRSNLSVTSLMMFRSCVLLSKLLTIPRLWQDPL